MSQEIDSILYSKRPFWNLDAISHIGYDDVCQIIRLHIFDKFSLWDQTRPFAPWAARLISCQIINLKEKFYGKFAPPCSGCEFNFGAGKCGYNANGLQGPECEKYLKWQIKKEASYRLLLPEIADRSYDIDPDGECRIKIESREEKDYEHAADKLHSLIMENLDEKKKQIYRWLFIEHRSEEYIAEKLGFHSNEKGKKPGYRQIRTFRKTFVERAKVIMQKEDVFSFE